ncbi:Fatty acyl-CoA reductase 2 [Vitis vinifera]|uniref:Fatty acyl-CoA reductase 2 n=1 Tax=Vitis vinifera TaxID=29760 RepID=A0A438EMV7_VITVI|nr:Fatty acyl-CoA reductase 2 [Vitis vinifera]
MLSKPQALVGPIVFYYGKGQLTGFLVDPKEVLYVVPADMVVNATLAAMAKHGVAGRPEMNIYHIASSVVNPSFPYTTTVPRPGQTSL